MKTVFFTKEPKVCKALIKKLPVNDKNCILSKSWYDIFSKYHKKIDLFVFDYRTFSHELFNLYEILKDNKITTPVIFYNDPFPESETRAKFWELQVYKQKNNISESKLNNYKYFFKELQKAIESIEIAPYISVIQKPLPFPGIKQNCNDQNIPQVFRPDKLPKSISPLFTILYNFKNQYIKPDFIQKELNKTGKQYKICSIYSYISRLRNYLEQQTNKHIDIINNKRGYKLITY